MSNSDYSWRSLWEMISTVRGLSLGSHSSTEDLGIGVVYHWIPIQVFPFLACYLQIVNGNGIQLILMELVSHTRP